MKKLGSMKIVGWLMLFFVLLLAVTTAFGREAAETLEAVAGEEVATHVSNMYATFWALVPPIIAIALALLTKEVYTSLFVGIVVGALFYANFNVEMTLTTVFTEGFIAKLADGWNVGILIFLVILGIMVQLINKAGGSAAYGDWAQKRIRTRLGAQLATFGLGALIFVDDYFNCLTVGSVMRPVTDRNKISRAKLAYLIDATAAPICMIAPISSWAAAVAGVAGSVGYNGLDLFIRAIPYNLYSLLTIVMVIAISVMKFDFGPMRTHEANAEKGDLYTTASRPYANIESEKGNTKGKVADLVVPILILIVSCVVGMIYTGGFFSGTNFIDAFAECDASLGLSLGAGVSLVLTFVYLFAIRRVLTFKEFAEAIPRGFSAMVPAILILTFAWTLGAMTGLLGGKEYVAALVEGSAAGFQMFLPAIVFAIAVGLSFATGTSWGTFGILLPIVIGVLDPSNELMIITVSACLAGAVCGDHCSPISDTTIMASTGAQSDHINHVNTQLPYALLVAGVSFVFYIVAGAVKSAWITLPIACVALVALLYGMKTIQQRRTRFQKQTMNG